MPLTGRGGRSRITPVRKAFYPLVAGMSSVCMCSCADFMNSFNDPLNGDFDPLDSPGSSGGIAQVEDAGPRYRTGQFVETTMPNTAFFGRIPGPNEQPARTLASATPLRVISMQGTYVKVELESGEIGFVPAIMVGEKPSPNEIPIVPVTPGNVRPQPEVGPGGSTLAPEPEIPPLSVEDASEVPLTDRIE